MWLCYSDAYILVKRARSIPSTTGAQAAENN